jgi:hypothetical protein
MCEGIRVRLKDAVAPMQLRMPGATTPKAIGWLDMLGSASQSGIVSIAVVQLGDSTFLVRRLGTTTFWRQLDSHDPQHWIREAAEVWRDLRAESSAFRPAELQELDS